ncbi:MAG TPA: hypothetical protein VN366_09955 [Feifaniaceae bacterium]|nr:hypothetical protein [Feifaniaceae bacterium]
MHPRRKNSIIRPLALLMALSLCGCASVSPRGAAGTPAPKAALTPAATLVPTPTPLPPPSVLFLTDCERDEIEPYVESLLRALSGRGWRVTQQYAAEAFPKELPAGAYDGVLVLRAKKGTSLEAIAGLSEQGTPVSVIDLFPDGEEPEGASYFRYEAEHAAEYALDIALSYPPHDAPVRLIGLFTEKGSPGHDAFRQAAKEGKVLGKGSFYGKKPQRAKEFMEERLDEYVEGTVDAVYAETLPLALSALLALTERGRTDMEVFAVPEGTVYLQRKLLQRYVFPVAMGAEPAEWAYLQVNALNGMMHGGAPVKNGIGVSAATYEEGVPAIGAQPQWFTMYNH